MHMLVDAQTRMSQTPADSPTRTQFNVLRRFENFWGSNSRYLGPVALFEFQGFNIK
jgi:hypothetical protein